MYAQPRTDLFLSADEYKRTIDDSSDRLFALGLTSVFFVLQLLAILHHQLWRDELQTWMLARHSSSISQLISLKKYEGHPDAWFLVIYVVTRLTNNPVGMKVAHLLIATVTVYIVTFYSHFTRLQKTLLVFGYFLFFEYATVSRNYALGILFTFIFCALFRSGPRKNYLILAIPLALLCQTSIYGVMIAFSFTVLLLFEATRSPKRLQFLLQSTRRLAFALVVLLASVSLSALHMAPPQDGAMPEPFPVDLTNFARSFCIFWDSFAPVPRFTWHFWETNLLWDANFLHGHGALLFLTPLSILICGVSILFFIRKPVVLLAYTSGITALFLFKHRVHFGGVRHDGHVFILFLACLWLASEFPDEQAPILKLQRIADRFAPFHDALLVGVFSLQAAVGLAVSVAALWVPFSEGKAVADFIHGRHMEDMLIVGDEDAPVSTVAGYLDRYIYYIKANRMGSFILWDKKRLADAHQPVVELATREAATRSADVLLILSYRADTIPSTARELGSFQHSMSGEDYYLYLLQHDKK
jgi:hypothetical protein